MTLAWLMCALQGVGFSGVTLTGSIQANIVRDGGEVFYFLSKDGAAYKLTYSESTYKEDIEPILRELKIGQPIIARGDLYWMNGRATFMMTAVSRIKVRAGHYSVAPTERK